MANFGCKALVSHVIHVSEASPFYWLRRLFYRGLLQPRGDVKNKMYAVINKMYAVINKMYAVKEKCMR